MTLRFDDLRTGENLAFFGSNDDEHWMRIGRAIKVGDSQFDCENPIGGYRYVKMESEDGPRHIP